MMLNKNLFILSVGQIFSFTSPVVSVLLSGIIGAGMTNINYLATLPTALMIVGTAVGSLFASKIMKMKGRKFGFSLAAIINSFFSLVCAYAVLINSFSLFCMGNLAIGLSVAFAQQYRFAATEAVETSNIPKAISLILLLGIVASLLGANIVSVTKNFYLTTYVGSYIAMSLLTILPFFFFLFYQNEDKIDQKEIKSQKTIFELLSNKNIQLSILSAGVGYTTMSTLMTATPISMNMMHGFSLFSTGIVLQLHVVGMFLPSLVTGDLIKTFGHKKMIYAGVIIMFSTILTHFIFETYYGYMIGLILLGVGWNFLFVSGTSLLVVSYNKEDKFLAQGLNDFVVFSSQSIGALSAGILLFSTSWKTLNLICLPLLILLLLFSILNNKKK
ncbi:MFS transporter [Alphaproteobacteria bacterium]|nr:MFS transporter [Alphaproteobacteria bacterium]